MENSNLKRLNEILKILKESKLTEGITPEKLRITLEKLGPTFIKLGQIASTRVEMLPKEYIESLSKLRSNTTPLSYEEIEIILKRNYDNLDEIFELIDKKPLATASIAQVHKAVLKENHQNVILKIKKPNIEKIMLEDINLMKKAIGILHIDKIFKIINLTKALDQFEQITKEETNFQIEAMHLVEFKEKNKTEKMIDCPKVYEKLSNNNVLVIEYINGFKINDVENLQKENYDITQISSDLCTNYIKQALTDGFFHADPHPDNILIKKSKIIYIDLGMMGRLSEKNKTLLTTCIDKIILEDYDEVSRILIKMSTQLDYVDFKRLTDDVSNILVEFKNKDLENINITKFLRQMINMLKNNHLELDDDITILIRGICIIEATIEQLDPKTNLVNVLLTSRKQNIFSYENIIDNSKKLIKNVDNMVNLPSEVSQLVKSLNNEEKKLKMEINSSNKTNDKLERLVHELIIGFIIGCLTVATVIVNEQTIRLIFICILVLLSLILFIKMITDIINKG